MIFLNKIAPQKFFLFVALTFGLLVIFITPPFQAPDEINHFYREWQLSEGQFLPVKMDDRVGGYIPRSLDSLTGFFKKIRFQKQPSITAEAVFLKFKILLNAEEKIFVDFQNTSVYNFVSYIPQIPVVYSCRKLNFAPLCIYYVSRVFTLLFWVSVLYLSIRLIPQYKWLFAVLGLLPMNLYISGSNSADVVSNASAVIFLSLLFHVTVSKKKLTAVYWILFLVCAFIVASAKLVYAPLLLLVIIIPKNAFNHLKNKILFVSSILLVTLLTLLLWSQISSEVYTPYDAYNVEYRNGLDLVSGSNMHQQIEYLKNNPFSVVTVFLKSVYSNAQSYSQSYIGRLGWYTIHLPIGIIILMYISIFLALIDYRNTYIPSTKQLVFIFLSITATLFLVIFSQYLTWENVGSERVYFLQGRYLTPVFPLVFIFISFFIKWRINWGNAPFILTSIVGGLVTIYSVFSWYY